VAASLLFGLLHPISWPYIVLTAFVGLCLGTLYLVTDNLLSVMVTHFLYDFTLMSYLLRYHYRGGPLNPIRPLDPDANIDDLT
jgi:membrane protease YdiL (CAAX protease family)